MSDLDSRTSADVKESVVKHRESDSEERTLEILSKNKCERANERSDSESESEREEEDKSGLGRESGSSVTELHGRDYSEEMNKEQNTNVKYPTAPN